MRKIKKVIYIIISLFTFLPLNIFAYGFDQLSLSAKEVGVYELDNLTPVYEKESTKKVPVASLTKIMTAIVCVENVNLDDTVIVDLPRVKQYYNQDYSVAGLKDKQEISYYDLLETMLLPSGADSAACIALNVFGNYDTFISKMNEKAHDLEMYNTSFSNPIGMDDENNYSTAKDMAIMLKYALQNKYIKYGITEYEHTIKDNSKTVHNALFQLSDIYGIKIPNITGGKTGMTEDAGYCLLSYSDTTPKPLICVVLGCEIKSGTLYHLSDTETIFEYIINEYSLKTILKRGDVVVTLPTINSSKNNVDIILDEDISIMIENDKNIDFSKVDVKYEGVNTLSPENNKGEKIGKVSVYYDGNFVASQDVFLKVKVPLSAKLWIKNYPFQAILVIILFICGVGLLIKVVIKIYNKNYGVVKYKNKT